MTDLEVIQFLIVWYLISGIVFGGFCAFVASQKNRSRGDWFVMGFLFTFIALIALVAIPALEPQNQEVDSEIIPDKDENRTVPVAITVISAALILALALTGVGLKFIFEID